MTNEVLKEYLIEMEDELLHGHPLANGRSPIGVLNYKACNCMANENCPFCSDEEVVQCDLGDTTCEACN